MILVVLVGRSGGGGGEEESYEKNENRRITGGTLKYLHSFCTSSTLDFWNRHCLNSYAKATCSIKLKFKLHSFQS